MVDEESVVNNLHKEIRTFLNEKEKFRNHWIWELLQNAIDVHATQIEVGYKDDTLQFKHNGECFELNQLLHLIRQGSSKHSWENGGKNVGKFGRGFITTCLLNTKAMVRGVVKNVAPGSFHTFFLEINREAANPKELKENLRDSQKRCAQSFKTISSEEALSAWTLFEFKSTNDSARETIRKGLETFQKLLPFVLAFNVELKEVKISLDSKDNTFKPVEEEEVPGSQIKSILIAGSTGRSKVFLLSSPNLELPAMSGNRATIQLALKTTESNEGGAIVWSIDLLDDVPKIFCAFPIFNTESFGWPSIIECSSFEPTPDRNGLFLGEENVADLHEDTKLNRTIFEKARELFVPAFLKVLVNNCNLIHYERLFTSFHPPATGYAYANWHKPLLKNIVDDVKTLDIVRTRAGFTRLDNALFIRAGEKWFDRFFDLCIEYKPWAGRVSEQGTAKEWSKVIEIFRKDLGIRDFDAQHCDLEGLAREIQLKKILPELVELVTLPHSQWLLGTIILIEEVKKDVLDTYAICPNVLGKFTKYNEIQLDQEIDREILEISKLTGKDFNEVLLDPKFVEIVPHAERGGKSINTEKVAQHVKEKVSQYVKDWKRFLEVNNGERYEINKRFFRWLVRNPIESIQRMLEHFVVRSVGGSAIELARNSRDFQYCLLPVNGWNLKNPRLTADDIGKFAELFPPDKIIHGDYYGLIDVADWQRLRAENMVFFPVDQKDGRSFIAFLNEVISNIKRRGFDAHFDVRFLKFLKDYAFPAAPDPTCWSWLDEVRTYPWTWKKGDKEPIPLNTDVLKEIFVGYEQDFSLGDENLGILLTDLGFNYSEVIFHIKLQKKKAEDPEYQKALNKILDLTSDQVHKFSDLIDQTREKGQILEILSNVSKLTKANLDAVVSIVQNEKLLQTVTTLSTVSPAIATQLAAMTPAEQANVSHLIEATRNNPRLLEITRSIASLVPESQDRVASLINFEGQQPGVLQSNQKIINQIYDFHGIDPEDPKKNADENRQRGERIERLFEEAVQLNGFEFIRDQKGSDYSIQFREESKHYVEVKSTVGDHFVDVRPLQVQKAWEHPEHYSLCVVPFAEDVLDVQRFKEKVRFVTNFADVARMDYCVKVVFRSEPYFQVPAEVWEGNRYKVLNYDEYIAYLRNLFIR